MAIAQPQPNDPLSSPDHSALHRIIASDPAGPVETITVDADGVVVVQAGNEKSISLSAGNGLIGAGGEVVVQAGSAVTDSDGGSIVLVAGLGAGLGKGGNIDMAAGSSSEFQGGSVVIESGSTSDGSGGDIRLFTALGIGTPGGIIIQDTDISLPDGTGYTINDILTFSGGNSDATLKVVDVNGSGGITNYKQLTEGSGYSIGSGISLTGGTGSGATANISVIDSKGNGMVKIFDPTGNFSAALDASLLSSNRVLSFPNADGTFVLVNGSGEVVSFHSIFPPGSLLQAQALGAMQGPFWVLGDYAVTLGFDNGGASIRLGDGSSTSNQLSINSGVGSNALLNTSSLTSARTFLFPDQDGTFAMLGDIPNNAVRRSNAQEFTGRVDDVGPIEWGPLSVGLYRFSYYLVDVVNDATAGTVTVNLTYTDRSGVQILSSTPILLTTVGSLTQGSFTTWVGDGAASYSFSTTHTGLYGTAVYDLFVSLETIFLD